MVNTFDNFVKFTFSQKEVSLVIAKDKIELANFVKTLESKDFKQVTDISDLFKDIIKPAKIFLVTKDILSKDMYDFVAQYPTGQVEIYDKFNLKSQMVIPTYQGVSIIFIITRESLGKTQASGFRLLEQVGISYQS